MRFALHVFVAFLFTIGAAFGAAPVIWNDAEYGKWLTTKGFKLTDSKEMRTISVDPSSGAGVAAAIGSIALRNNAGAGELWLKSGAADTAWTKLMGTITLPVTAANGGTGQDSSAWSGIPHVSGGTWSASAIVNADIDAAAGIVDTKLATISTAGKVSNSATTATDANTNSAIVARDGSGNFSASTATLTGLAVNGTTGLSWNGGSASTALETIGTAGSGGSLLIQTPSLNSNFNSGLGISGTYGALISTITLQALGVNSPGGYGSRLVFKTTSDIASTAALTLDETQAATFANTVNATTFVGALTGNASTATALAANPSDCAADTYATTIAASGNLTCATVTNAGLAGSIAASKLVGTDIATVGTVTTGTWSADTIAVNKGGTGQTTATNAFDALAPTTTSGDMIYHNGSDNVRLAAGSLGQVLQSMGGTPTWTDPPAGGVNYAMPYHNAEGNVTTGWTTYDDAAATPVDLDSGTFGGTFAVSSTTPVYGTYSYLYTPGTTGEGVRAVITPQAADKGQVLEIAFDYTFVSATGATGDYTVWVYDVTNATLVQPAGYTVPGATAGTAMRFKATFQTSTNGATYRIAIHQAASTSAAIKFDSVYVGPQVKSNGPYISDWTAYTPTGAWVANTTFSGFWRRVGDTMEVYCKAVTSGAPTSALFSCSLPSGYTIDTNKISTSTLSIYGQASAWDNGIANYSGFVIYASTTTVNVIDDNAGTYWTQAAPFTFGANDEIKAYFKVPITGWSSSSVLSSADDGRTVAAVYTTATAGSYSNSAEAVVDFGTKELDTHNAVTTGGSWTFTAPVPGVYDVDAMVGISSSGFSGGFELRLYKNGSGTATVRSAYNTFSTGGFFGTPQFATQLYLNAGDTLQVKLRNDYGASVGLQTFAAANRISIVRNSQATQIAASETVSAQYKSSAGQSISNGAAPVVDFATKEWDSHNAVTTGASWKFTAPMPGIYEVCSMMEFASASWSATGYIWPLVAKNGGGAVTLAFERIEVSQTTGFIAQGCKDMRLLAGDYVQVSVQHAEGSARSLSANTDRNWVQIKRVANY
jgi:hypothetical protein